jgi:hypothetical protein
MSSPFPFPAFVLQLLFTEWLTLTDVAPLLLSFGNQDQILEYLKISSKHCTSTQIVNFCYCSSPWESNLILELNWILKYYNKLNKIGICGCILLHNELFYNLLSKMKISYLDIRIDDKYVGEFHSKGFKVLLTSQAKTLNELEIVICGYLNSSLFRKLNILENLTKLTIEQNMSSEYVYFYDFKNLQNLKKLVHLNLKGYQISFKSIESLFHSFAFFTILETLSLTNCCPKIFENNNLSWKNLFHLKKLVRERVLLFYVFRFSGKQFRELVNGNHVVDRQYYGLYFELLNSTNSQNYKSYGDFSFFEYLFGHGLPGYFSNFQDIIYISNDAVYIED